MNCSVWEDQPSLASSIKDTSNINDYLTQAPYELCYQVEWEGRSTDLYR